MTGHGGLALLERRRGGGGAGLHLFQRRLSSAVESGGRLRPDQAVDERVLAEDLLLEQRHGGRAHVVEGFH